MLGKTSWYSIDVSGNDRHILLFYKKCHFCYLLPFAKVGQNIGLWVLQGVVIRSLRPKYSIGGCGWIFINLLKSAAFTPETLENNLKSWITLKDIEGQQWSLERELCANTYRCFDLFIFVCLFVFCKFLKILMVLDNWLCIDPSEHPLYNTDKVL